jgi:hypothetical protein
MIRCVEGLNELAAVYKPGALRGRDNSAPQGRVSPDTGGQSPPPYIEVDFDFDLKDFEFDFDF